MFDRQLFSGAARLVCAPEKVVGIDVVVLVADRGWVEHDPQAGLLGPEAEVDVLAAEQAFA